MLYIVKSAGPSRLVLSVPLLNASGNIELRIELIESQNLRKFILQICDLSIADQFRRYL